MLPYLAESNYQLPNKKYLDVVSIGLFIGMVIYFVLIIHIKELLVLVAVKYQTSKRKL